MDAHDVAVVLRAAEASRYHPALVLIASTGLRKGEALALRWDRVDLDAGTLKVAAYIRCATLPRWNGSSQACISRRWPICSGIRRS